MSGQLAELLAADGQLEAALIASAESLERTRKSEAFWWLPEALRIRGDVIAQADGGFSQLAENHLRQSIEISAKQAALEWELRAATSLSILLRDAGRDEEAAHTLHGTVSNFVEGFETIPFRRAKALL
ncbi:hypothetical protein, partial [Treponema endosymbiont of Eucomonympha sp.]|uniref:hypothetical protein n=1 Tax=Treponema endosymbiont of Eucomonympha sp. TaxID=1580831 RepID=UPI0019311545